MKEINLRDYYPFYTQDMIVEVPDEVADLLREYKLAEAAYILRTYRHKAYFSLDYDTSVERDALVIVLTPAEILEQQGGKCQAVSGACFPAGETAKPDHFAFSARHEPFGNCKERGFRRQLCA